MVEFSGWIDPPTGETVAELRDDVRGPAAYVASDGECGFWCCHGQRWTGGFLPVALGILAAGEYVTRGAR